jgi:hypothetical protein
MSDKKLSKCNAVEHTVTADGRGCECGYFVQLEEVGRTRDNCREAMLIATDASPGLRKYYYEELSKLDAEASK